MGATNSKFSFASPQSQRFPFPYDMILKMTKNPNSSIGYMKLLKTCKWFFANGKILPVPCIALLKEVLWISNNRSIDFSTMIYKLWITKNLNIYQNQVYLFSLFTSKLYRCDAPIHFERNNSLDILKDLLTLPLNNDISLHARKEKVDDPSMSLVISINEILDILPAKYSLTCSPGNGDLYLVKIKPNSKNNSVRWCFYGLPNDFDVQSVYENAKKHKNGQDLVDIYFSFYNKLSTDYTNELNNFAKNVIKECRALKILPPMLSFPGSNKEAMDELETLRDNYKKKKCLRETHAIR